MEREFDPFAGLTKVYTYQDLFPYPSYRNDQEEITREISEAIAAKKNCILVASNGTGKTIMALTAILPVAIAEKKKIIFCSRTFTQNERVIEESRLIAKHLFDQQEPLMIGVLSIRGRNEMCVHKTIQRLNLPPHESMNVCADLRKKKQCPYFLALSKNREKIKQDAKHLCTNPINASELIQLAENRGVCPYFFGKMLIEYMPVIVCNYQWIFEPDIRQNFLEGMHIGLENCIVIMDEAHNLPDMANEINSYRLTPYSIRQALKDLEVYRATEKLITFLRELRDILTNSGKHVEEEVSLDPHRFIQLILNKNKLNSLPELQALIQNLDEYGNAINQEKVDSGQLSRDFISPIIEFFQKFLENMDNPAYFPCMTAKDSRQGKSVTLEMKCLDPRPITDPIFKGTYATLSLSGTLHPFLYTQLLGLNETGKALKEIKMKPPFPKEHIYACVLEQLNTRGENRTDDMYTAINEALYVIIRGVPKNVGVFCASYVVLDGLLKTGIEQIVNNTGKTFFCENPALTSSENDILIEQYKDKSKTTGAVLLGVCGGRNSEGEDFPGDFMNAVAIVGIPYQRPTPSLEAKIKYYETLFPTKGRQLSYIIPAFQRSNQACGRPIRRPEDWAMVFLIDYRFAQNQNLISDWIVDSLHFLTNDAEVIKREIQQFYAKRNNLQK